MKRSLSSLIWGLAFIAAGIVIVGNIFDLWNFRLFFNGWWTLFLIVPCLVSIFSGGPKAGNLIGLGIGVMLLLSAQDIISGDMARRLIFPGVLIIVGISILFGGRGFIHSQKIPKGKDGAPEFSAIFSGRNCSFNGQTFNGGTFTSIFGGIDVDLRGAVIEPESVIEVVAIFGGVTIRVPANLRVVVRATPIFGGVTNKAVQAEGPTLYVTGLCLFGGADVKS